MSTQPESAYLRAPHQLGDVPGIPTGSITTDDSAAADTVHGDLQII